MITDKIEKVAVIGGGTMGPGIAQTFAQYKYSVHICDLNEQALNKAKTIIRTNLKTLERHNKVKADLIESIENRITYTSSLYTAALQADLIVECITEDRNLKSTLYSQLDKICGKETILLSNTSYLNIFELMPKARQATTAIAHWFAPPHIIPLVEVVKGPLTSEITITPVVELLRQIGKTPVVIEKYVPGFVINRIQRILGREVFFLLDNGYITAEQLDLAVKASIAPRMMLLGLVQRYDFTGLDLSAKNLENPNYLEPPIDNRPKSLFDLVEKGHLGVKTGKGFYDYSDKKLEETLNERDDNLLKILESVDFLFEKG